VAEELAGKRSDRGGSRQVGYAVVGLGHIAQTAVLPAFGHAKRNSRIVAFVSGDARKRRSLGHTYGVNSYSYEDLDACLAQHEVDAVYVALPNALHKDCAVRAARAGVHVLCEKPMATSAADCEEMIRAARDSDVKLMIAYRLHFEEANLSTLDIVTSGKIGEPRFFTSELSYQVKAENIRTEARLGGGALWDLGVYCVNAARHLFRDEPVEAMAMAAQRADDDRFGEVPEAWTCQLRFPDDRLATFTVSFGAATTGRYRIVGTKGDVALDPAYEHERALVRHVTVNEHTRSKRFAHRDQFARELLHFSTCVLDGKDPEASGLEGLADVRVIEALLESSRTGSSVKLQPLQRRDRPTLDQEQPLAPGKQPETVEVGQPGT
jgi:predicted dehydrogenase